MKRLSTISLALAVLGITSVAAALEPADLTGTWTWKYANQSAVHTLELKLDGDKLTGSIQSYQNARVAQIEDPAYKDGTVTFKHTYKGRDGQIHVAAYTGAVSGDTIKGTIEIKLPDRTISRAWHATRAE